MKPSERLIHFIKINNIETLGGLLLMDDVSIFKLKGFDYHLLKEILQLREIE